MSLSAEGLGPPCEGSWASMTSLKRVFPMFKASWNHREVKTKWLKQRPLADEPSEILTLQLSTFLAVLDPASPQSLPTRPHKLWLSQSAQARLLIKPHPQVPLSPPHPHQQFRGTQQVQGEGLHARESHAQLAVDARALDAGEHAQVGAEPRGVCKGGQLVPGGVGPSPPLPPPSSEAPHSLGPAAPQSQHWPLPGRFFTSAMSSLVRSWSSPSSPVPPQGPGQPLGSPRKALLRASSLLF